MHFIFLWEDYPCQLCYFLSPFLFFSIRKLVSLQKEFLWDGGDEGGRRIVWVK